MFLLDLDSSHQKQSFAELDSRDRILFSAMEIIATDGVEAANTRAIASRAGLTIGMIWKCFGTKENLISEINEHTKDVIIRCFAESSIDELSDIPTWLLNIGGEFAKSHMLEFAYFRRCAADASKASHELLRTYARECEKHFRAMQDKGRLRADVDTRQVATTTLFLAVGILVAGPLMEDTWNEGDRSGSTEKTYADFLEQLYSHGIV